VLTHQWHLKAWWRGTVAGTCALTDLTLHCRHMACSGTWHQPQTHLQHMPHCTLPPPSQEQRAQRPGPASQYLVRLLQFSKNLACRRSSAASRAWGSLRGFATRRESAAVVAVSAVSASSGCWLRYRAMTRWVSSCIHSTADASRVPKASNQSTVLLSPKIWCRNAPRIGSETQLLLFLLTYYYSDLLTYLHIYLLTYVLTYLLSVTVPLLLY